MEKEAGERETRAAEECAGSGSAPLDVEKGGEDGKGRGKGAKKRSGKSRRKREKLVITDHRMASFIKFCFNSFFVFELFVYAGFLNVFLRLCESWGEALLGIMVTCPLVVGTLFALPIVRDVFVEGFAMGPADSDVRGSKLPADSSDNDVSGSKLLADSDNDVSGSKLVASEKM